ncbi:MAG TPA: HEAT repeat domain-containing protein [Phycisphaerae bacterium]|nr:HEAT repeat domain-containing protein [Phycisphaerae bacterium]
MHHPRPLLLQAAALGLLPILLASCGNGSISSARDFNELIPRLMGAVNSNESPERAAANLFNVTSPDERRDAIAYLQTKKYGHQPPYMKAYTLLATDPHPQVRGQALRALGTSGDPAIVPILIKGLNDPEASVRADAAAALDGTWAPSAETALRTHLHDDADDQVKINCAHALRHFGTPTAIRALIDALDDRNAAVAYWSHESLIALTGQKMPTDTKIWLTWFQSRYGPAAGATGAG